MRNSVSHWVALHEALGIGRPIASEARYGVGARAGAVGVAGEPADRTRRGEPTEDGVGVGFAGVSCRSGHGSPTRPMGR